MKPVWIVFYLVMHGMASFSQKAGGFKPLRYEEDYSYLRDSSRTSYQSIKFVPINKSATHYMTVGGEWRGQYFYTKNEQWGDAPDDYNGYLLTRMLAHADMHLGKRFRTFVQLQSSLAGSRIDPGPIDDNPLELHQAFADWNQHIGALAVTTRIGRQEFLYGSQRLIAVREGPNHRLSFDAVKSIIQFEQSKLDLFYSHPVAVKKDIFNDGFNGEAKLWGAYFVHRHSDFYYLGIWKRDALFDDGAGREIRHSVGSRWSNQAGNWKYDWEALVQFGKFGEKNIFAWTSSINTSYTFKTAALSPEIGVKTELISGDKTKGDNRLQTFNPLYPRGAYFGLAALIGPANLIDVHPSLTLSLKKNWELVFDYDVFWRYSKNDGLYAVNAALLYPSANSQERFIGHQPAVNTTYKLNNFIAATVEFTWFNAGAFLKDAGEGKDIVFTGITTQFKF